MSLFTKNPDLKTIKFDNQELEIKFLKYQNDQIAIKLYDNGEPRLTATVCINVPDTPNYNLDDKDVVIKNYSENAGVLEALIANNIIEKPHAELPCNRVTLYVAKLK